MSERAIQYAKIKMSPLNSDHSNKVSRIYIFSLNLLKSFMLHAHAKNRKHIYNGNLQNKGTRFMAR